MAHAAATRRNVPLRRKLLGLALGTVASLLTFECVLWALHSQVEPEQRAQVTIAPKAEGERRILCVGDSNTYGVYIEPEESYPGRLQRYLDRAPGNPWRVINVGYPGFNTAQMRARFAGHLDTYQPDIAIVWGGVNNSWSPMMGHLWDYPDHEPDASERGLLEHSRAYRALRMIFLEGRLMSATVDAAQATASVDGAVPDRPDLATQPDPTRVRPSNPDDDDVRESIRIDLNRIATLCEEGGVRLVLGQYWSSPPWIDGRINAPIARVAEERQVPLVPATARMRELVETYGHTRVLTGDDHASAVGNREVARLVLGALIDAELLPARPEWSDLPPLEEVLDAPHLSLVSAEGGEVRLELVARPRHRFALDAEVLVLPAGATEPVALRVIGEQEARKLTRGEEQPVVTGVGFLPRGVVGRFGSITTFAHLPLDPPPVGSVYNPEGLVGDVIGWRLRADVMSPKARMSPKAGAREVESSNTLDVLRRADGSVPGED